MNECIYIRVNEGRELREGEGWWKEGWGGVEEGWVKVGWGEGDVYLYNQFALQSHQPLPQ